MGLPCMATNCTGMKELLDEDRGYLVGYEYKHIDPFGNGNRYWINTTEGSKVLSCLYDKRPPLNNLGRNFIEKRNWKNGIETLDKAIRE